MIDNPADCPRCGNYIQKGQGHAFGCEMAPPEFKASYKCTVKGHDHELTLVRKMFQKGTIHEAQLMECPTGYYRYLVFAEDELPGGPFYPQPGGGTIQVRRFKRPRWGWGK